MRQSKTLILSTNVDKNRKWQSFRLQFVARLLQSKTLFLAIFLSAFMRGFRGGGV